MVPKDHPRIINHKVLRKGTGIIALLLPFVAVWLSGEKELTSVSVSYWTDSGDIFVGSLIAVAFFLAAYNGTSNCRKDTEYYLSKCAGFFALVVALIPTNCNLNDCAEVPEWVSKITFDKAPFIHNFAAIFLFILLFLLISFFARRAKYKEKLPRSRFYSAISLGMLIGMPLVYVIGHYVNWYNPIYGVEFLGLVLFGMGWLTAGSYKSEPKEEVPKTALKLAEIEVDPVNKNFPTNIEVKEGEEYLFEAEGCWKDYFLSCGPNGWGASWNPLALKNRIKRQPVFMLCGNVGKSWDDEHLTFAIGDNKTWIVPTQVNGLKPEERKLFLFANDWENKYDNNSGAMRVVIYKLNKLI